VKFGLGVPTATEGLMYPIPYADANDAVGIALLAEELGYDSVWANDHLTTQRYVREAFEHPPRFFDPLTYLAFVAARTERIRIATCVLVAPFRHPVVAAKQAATLDHLSGGRLVLGVGVGAYREEVEATWPGRTIHRGEYTDEFVEAVAALFATRRASFRGRWITFDDIESHPKPRQSHLPVLAGGNSPGARRRAALHGDGWLPACLSIKEVAAGAAEISRWAEDAGRALPVDFEVALQLVVSVAPTREAAVERFRSSQVHAHLRSLSESTLKEQQRGGLEQRNLVGTPADVLEQIDAYAAAGVDTMAGLLFAADDVEETREAMQFFAEEVIECSTS
jgi:probable F420-dependent oxidoreductase